MSDRDDLLALTRQAKEHLAWLDRGGVVGLPPSPPQTQTRTQAQAQTQTRPPVPSVPGTGAAALALIRTELGDCQRCKLAPKRTNIVYGVGNPDAALVFVGEAPGSDEDRTGEPFVGAAGQLLTKMIEAMGLGRQDVYICNILKCRPPGNRNPEPDEIAEC
ncbi:MAG: uracil-DNA glycosylase, partial [Polyangia bacterium]